MNQKEENARKIFPYCNNIQEREDIIFLYPDEFSKDPSIISDELQRAVIFLKLITNLNPTTFFEQRTVIGYLFKKNREEKVGQPVWDPRHNSVIIPWRYLKMPNEPLDVCTHELVHPFFRCSPLHNRNEGWGDGFCDFLRGPLKKQLGLDGDGWWQRVIKVALDKEVDSDHQYPAGQFVLKAYEDYKLTDGSRTISDLMNDQKAISAFVKFLFSKFENVSLSTYITPSSKMIKNWKDKGKI